MSNNIKNRGTKNLPVGSSSGEMEPIEDDEEEIFYDSLCDLEFDEMKNQVAVKTEGLNLASKVAVKTEGLNLASKVAVKTEGLNLASKVAVKTEGLNLASKVAVKTDGLSLASNVAVSNSDKGSKLKVWISNRAKSLKAEAGVTGVYLDPRLEDYEDSFYSWISGSKPFTFDEAKLIVEKEKVETIVEERLTKYLQWRPLETVSNHIILAFCHLIMQNFTESVRELDLIVKFLGIAGDSGYISQDHMTGLADVYYGLIVVSQSFLMSTGFKHQHHANNFNQHIQNCIKINKSNDYGASTKAAIAFVKAVFFGARHLREKQIAAAEEVVAVEKRNVEFWIYLYNAYRLERKGGGDSNGPLESEKSALINAWNVHKHHPLVKLSISLYLSDKLRKLRFRLPRYGWNVLNGVAQFLTVDEVANYILKNCESLLEGSGMNESIRDNVSIGTLYMSGLPHGFEDYNAASNCLAAAVAMNPNCSSANHKLGILQMLLGNPFECGFSLVQQAFVIDPRNFAALIDCLQMLLSKVDSKEHRGMIMTLLQDNLTEDKWSKTNLVSLHMVKGFLFFMTGDKEAAILTFKQAYAINPEQVEEALKKLPSPIRRYKWDERLISHQAILDHLNVEINYLTTNNWNNETSNALEVYKLMRKCVIFALNTHTFHRAQNGRGGGHNNAGQRDAASSYRGGGATRGRQGQYHSYYDEHRVSNVHGNQYYQHQYSYNNSSNVGDRRYQQSGIHNLLHIDVGYNDTEPDSTHANNFPRGYPTIRAAIAACDKNWGPGKN